MILITSASGMTGLATIRALVRKGYGEKIAGLARSDASRALILGAGAQTVLPGDVRNRDSLAKAMQGVDTVFHICARMQLDETVIGHTVIEAAEAAGVARFVLHSVVSSQIDDIVFHAAKRAVELRLIKSKLSFAILQPNSYMQNLGWSWPDIRDRSQFVMPYSTEVPMHWVDIDDYGEAAAEIILDPGYAFGTYECVGTERPVNRCEIAALLSARLGRDIRAVTMPLDAYMRQPRWANRPAVEMDRLRTMFQFMDAHGGGTGNNKVLSMILNRPPRSYEAFVDTFVRDLEAADQAMQACSSRQTVSAQ